MITVTQEHGPAGGMTTATVRLAFRNAGAFGSVFFLLVIWEAATRAFGVPHWLLPAPSRIAVAAWEWRDSLVSNTLVTLSETVAGFALALAVSVPLAMLLVGSSFFRWLLDPLLVALQAVPKNALAPILILWFGGGQLSKIAVTFLVSFFPIVVNAVSGMRLVDNDMLDLARSLKASKLQTFLHVRLPNAIPHLFAACKVAVTLAVVGAVIGEFVGSDAGLGYLILSSSSQLLTEVAFAAIIMLAASGIGLYSLVGLAEQLVLPWARGQDTEPSGDDEL
jgi:NitT/TauT family transport system permease protein